MISESPGVFGHIAVRLNHYIIIIGGTLATSEDSEQNHVIWRYNLYTEQWRKYLIPKTKETPDLHSRGLQRTDTAECAVTIEESVYTYLIDSSSIIQQALWKLTQTTHGCYVWEKVLAMNSTKIPYPSDNFSCWEYSKEMLILGGFGPELDGYLNEHGKRSDGNVGHSYQLLKFNPVSKEWSNPRSSGTAPTYHMAHTTTAIGHKVWLYRTVPSDKLYELDMQSRIWTCIQVSQPHPQKRALCSLNALTESQLVMHGGLSIGGYTFSETWVLDLQSRSWKTYTSYEAHPRRGHTGSLGLNNDIIIIGGKSRRFDKVDMLKHIFHVMFEPKCLQQLAMQAVFKHRAELPLMSLPRKLRKCLDTEIGDRQCSAENTLTSVKPRRATEKPEPSKS